ncbi:translation initiation factor eIF-2 alpha subunit [Cystobasidium minutum MCA 4210]|uniref:translation initiation factor eIF-2 alpha subunit n=1 Tax=Cystobasidium minutum MCA 4210 TaxID=1397322 RepID=UPI0034CE8C85|eukprot:jgi/Rhomi1/185148/estExt_fgenesh1_pm.C_20151
MRFYREKYPEPDTQVMVQVKQIQENGAYVKLLEYDNVEGMILLSELSRRRIRSIQKLIRVGRNEVVMVMRIDKEKGYIDLSKRRVSADDVVKCEEKFNKSKAVHSIMRHVAERTETDLEKINEMIAWPLYDKFGHAYDAFKLSITDPSVFDGLNIPEDILAETKANIARRLTPQPVKIRADIEMSCFSYAGIDAIKRALRAGEAVGTESIPIKIKLVSPPLFVMISNATDKNGAIETMERAIAVIDKSISKDKGRLEVKLRPKAVSETDDLELNALMERAARENKEVSGDEESDEE